MTETTPATRRLDIPPHPHTDGTWHLAGPLPDGHYLLLAARPDRDLAVAVTRRDDITLDEERGNAALLKAAPALLYACIEMFADLGIMVDGHPAECECSACRSSQLGCDALIEAGTLPPAAPETAMPATDRDDPHALAEAMRALPPLLGRALAQVWEQHRESLHQAALTAARARAEHWQALAAAVREDLGRYECGAELLAAAELSMPEDWHSHVSHWPVTIRLPGLCPLRVVYTAHHLVDGGQRWERPSASWGVVLHENMVSQVPTLEEALLAAYYGDVPAAPAVNDNEIPF